MGICTSAPSAGTSSHHSGVSNVNICDFESATDVFVTLQSFRNCCENSRGHNLMESKRRLMGALAEYEKMPSATEILGLFLEREFPTLYGMEESCNGRSFMYETLARRMLQEAARQYAADSTAGSSGPPPASKRAILDLPRTTNPHHCPSSICNVCYDHYSNNSVVTQLPCGHYFHMPCVVSWLERHCTCPVCRYELSTDDLSYEYERKKRMGEIPEETTREETPDSTNNTETNAISSSYRTFFSLLGVRLDSDPPSSQHTDARDELSPQIE